jgi:glucose-6-phosphate dehydrogenase assembly protein OpcA
MSVRLDDTTAAQVGTAISAERFRQGSSAVGRVLTLVIITDEASQSDAVRAAAEAAREHPCRILTAIPRPGRGPARLDAEITVGGSDGLGELAVLRLRGALSHHIASVVLPLLVPDAPVVAWWPEEAPEVPSQDPVGKLAQRRITDSSASSRPLKTLDLRRRSYHAGDTDLAWTRLTPWRALIASALDLPYETITGASVHVQRSNPSGVLLAAWMQRGLGVPVAVHTSRGPGITEVTIHTKRGDISITRPDGRVATMTRPGFPDREAALQRRSLEGLIAEELRRLDPDEIYGETLDALPRLADFAPHAGAGEKAVRRGSTEAPVTRTARADAGTPENVRNAPTAATPSVRGKRAPATRTATATKVTPTKAAAPKSAATKSAPKKAAATKSAATKSAAKGAAAKTAPKKAAPKRAATTTKTAAAKPGSRSRS